MSRQIFPNDEEASLAFQVEAVQAASPNDVTSRRRTRFLFTGLGFAVLMLLGVASHALHPIALHASVAPSHLVRELAWTPMIGMHAVRHPGSGHARQIAFRPVLARGSRPASLRGVQQSLGLQAASSEAELFYAISSDDLAYDDHVVDSQPQQVNQSQHMQLPREEWAEGRARFYHFLKEKIGVRDSLLTLQQAIAYWPHSLHQVELATVFRDLFVQLSEDDLRAVRLELDTNLVFRQDGVHVDLRALVFDVLDSASRRDVLSHMINTCKWTPGGLKLHEDAGGLKKRFVVLTDVDDTLKPGHDPFHVTGEDRSWRMDGSLYPGVVQMHRELRGDGPDDFSVILTARTARNCKSLPSKLSRLIGGEDKPRLSILSGSSSTMGSVERFVKTKISKTKFRRTVGQQKIIRLKQYAQLYPDFAGQFVFIGDDGQADSDASVEMLAQKVPGTDQHVLAFVAIHAVRNKDGTFKIHPQEREDIIRIRREAFPPIDQRSSDSHVLDPAAFPPQRESVQQAQGQRFFYYENYGDLASQLSEAGWISHDSAQRVTESFIRESYAPAISDDPTASKRTWVKEWLKNKANMKTQQKEA